MDDCIFCKIIKGEIPSYKIYENDSVFAFLDITPVTRGHTLVIPKKHYVNLYDIPKDLLVDITSAAQSIALKMKDNLETDGVNLVQSTEKAAHQEVMHFHLHVVPRYKNDGGTIWEFEKIKNPDLESIQKRLV
ncbi:HIT family protein [Patescibacteria group bacterium]